MALLEVKDLRVEFHTDDGIVKAVDGVDFVLDRGETLGIVGESGSGKSVSCLSILGLARGGKVSGEALFQDRDLLKMHSDEMRAIRGKQIAMIFQDPLSSLHPYYKVGAQIVEAIQAHEKIPKKDAHKRAVELLGLVGIPRPERRTAIIMIPHDLGVVADMADTVLVMYGGRPAVVADRRTVYYSPHHPYTWGLLQSIPSVGAEHTNDRLRPIKGLPPSLIHPPSGCKFHPRCPYVMDVCTKEEPQLLPAGGNGAHLSACHLSLEEKQRIWQQEVAPTR